MDDTKGRHQKDAAPDRIIISTYPSRSSEHLKSTGGPARYIKILLDAIDTVKFTVLCEKFDFKDTQYVDRNGNSIIPTWKRGSLAGLWQIIRFLSNNKVSSIIINHDFGIFGSMLTTIFFPFVLIAARLKTPHLSLIQHSGLTDLREISGHLQLSSNDPRIFIYSFGMQIELILFSLLCEHIVVTESAIKKRFSGLPLTDARKFEIIPLPIFTSETPIRLTSRESDKPFTILFFGFLTWYKGADWLISCTKDPLWPKDVTVVMAGGKTLNQKNDQYYDDLLNSMSQATHVRHTGFVPEEKVPEYFDSADLVILPYRVMMAASGPLATAIGRGKPFLISEEVLPYTETEDFAHALLSCNLKRQDISFSLDTYQNLIEKLRRLKSNPDRLKKLARLSESLRSSRTVHAIASRFSSLLLQHPE